MDIANKENKMMSPDEVKNKAADTPTSQRAVSQLMWEYFFPGGGIWKPMTVKAPNREQAEEIHKDTREPIAPAEEKVEESETNNQ
jgi:hypothetical protein